MNTEVREWGLDLNNKELYQRIQDRLPKWARSNILTGLCGSHIHGTYIEPEAAYGTDDIDVFQIVIHPRTFYLGLDYYQHKEDSFQTHGESLDIVVYDLPKYVYLLTQGNPNVNSYLWLEPYEYLGESSAGRILIDSREHFLSQKMFLSFGGYAYGQLKRMTHGERLGYMGLKRKQLLETHGYDTKNAAHCIRLFYTAIHLAKYNTLKIKLTGDELTLVKSIKRGERNVGEVERLAIDLNDQFLTIKKASPLPKEVDRDTVNEILKKTFEAAWNNMEAGR